MTPFEIAYPEGWLDVATCLQSGQVFRFQEADGVWTGSDGANTYSIRLGNPLSVTSNATPEALSSFFRLDWDAESVEGQILRCEPEMEPVMGGLRGLRVLRPSCPHETFYSFLCTPNNNLTRITGMVRFLASMGEDGVFPGTEVIAALPEALLRERKFGYRARTIPNVAQHVLEKGGDVWIESLKSLSYEEAHRELLGIPGIGPKLADCICLFALDHSEAVPVDTHVYQVAVRRYFPEMAGKALTDLRYRMIGDFFRDRFGSLAGWAHQYLFLDNLRRVASERRLSR